MVIKPPGGSLGGSFTMPSRGGGLVPQVQDQWGRSPSHPEYRQPPGGAPPVSGFQPQPMESPQGDMPSYTAGPPVQAQMPAPSGMQAQPNLPPTWGTVGTRLGQSTVQTQPQGGGMSLYGLGVPGMQQGGWLQPSQGQTLANPWNPFQGRLAGMIRG